MRASLAALSMAFASSVLAGCGQAPPPDPAPAPLAAALARAREAYPELALARIELLPMRSDGFFFQAQPRPRDAFRRPGLRTYRVYYSPGVLVDGPGDEALAGVLAHELAHVLDYTRMSGAELADFALRYLCVREFRVAYERGTDLEAALRGFGGGLAAYNRWMYGRVSPELVRIKKESYLSPEELEVLAAGPTAVP